MINLKIQSGKKFAKIKSILFKTPLVLIFICLLASCEKDSPLIDKTAITDQEDQEILDYLASLEYDLDSVSIKQDVVFFNHDSGVLRKDILDAARGNILPFVANDPDAADMSIEARERQRNNMNDANLLNAITATNVTSITYFIRPSVSNDLGNLWFNAIIRAADDWTALTNCRIAFNRTFDQNQADIIVASSSDGVLPTSMQTGNMNSSALATALGPVNGNPGQFISINENNSSWTLRKKNVLIHEFGHTLGFSHTATSSIPGSQVVHGTSHLDPQSMMQPNHLFILGLLNLSMMDIRMARVLYPDNYSRPTNFTAIRNAPGEVKLSYKNPNPVSKPYYWIRAAKYDLNGTILATRYFYSETNNVTGNHSMTWGGHSTNQTFLFALRGCNFRKDVWSSRTQQIKVDLN